MALHDEFKEAVSSKNERLTRIMIKDIMLEDKTLETYKEAISYAEQNMDGLFDDHDGEEFSYDTALWDEDVLDNQMVSVVFNFSKERLDYICSLIKHLYADEIYEENTEKFIEEHSVSPETMKKVGTGLIAAGAVATVAGVASAVTSEATVSAAAVTLGAAGVACLVAGGVIIYKSK